MAGRSEAVGALKEYEKRDTAQFLQMIAPKYLGVYVVDRKTDTFRDLLRPGYVREMEKGQDVHFSTGMKMYRDRYIEPADRGLVTALLDYDRVYKTLMSGQEVNASYRKTDGTFIQLRVGRYSDKEEEKDLSIWLFADESLEYRRQIGLTDAVSDFLHSSVTAGLWYDEFDMKGNRTRCIWSPSFKRIVGYDYPFEITDPWSIWFEKIHPEDQARVNREYRKHIFDEKDKTSYDIEYRLRDSQGIYHWYRDTAYINRRPDGMPICANGMIIQVDERHEAEERMQAALKRESEQRKLLEEYQTQREEQLAIFNALSDTYANILLLDLEHETVKVLKVNGFVNRFLFTKAAGESYDHRTVATRYVLERVHPADRDMMLDAISPKRVREELSHSDEYTGNYSVLEDGERKYFQFKFVKSKDVSYVIAGFQNVDSITKEVQQRRAQMEALCMDYTAVFNCDLMKDTMTVVKVKDSAHVHEKMSHTSSFSHWIQYSFEHMVIKDTAPHFLEELDRHHLMKYLETHESFISRHRATPNSQGLEYFEIRVVPVYRNENTYQVMFAYRPIDDLVAAEKKQQEQLSLALAAAEQSSRAKTTFLNNMSHDIRTPMNAIIGFTALAQTHIENRKLVEDYLSKINTSSTHLLSLINDILDMSRIESGSVKLEEKPVHIPDLLHDLRTMIQGLVNAKQQNLYIDTQDVEHEDVVIDKLRMNQVLLNIVSNAIKFTQVGGDIIIRLAEKLCAKKGYTTYEFTIKDNGIGMSEEFISHVFDTFAREFTSTVSGIQGTGLGMAITKNIVDMMGGTITVESEEGKGTQFVVTLDMRLASQAILYEPIPELAGARSLVVDDDINTCRSVCKMLRSIGMRPDWTASGKEAILRAQDASELQDEYKVYIVDYLMPDMNGIETVRRIRKVIGVEIPIIVLTAYDWGDFEREAREAGVTAFVAKPIFMSELRSVLTRPTSENEEVKPAETETYDYSGKHILLVEDNELNREIATAILGETGMTIDTAEDGIEAVSIMSKAPEDYYDLILMDIQMPRMDGYTATREIRTLPNNKKANIPIVAMTANAFDEDRRKAFETGMNGHIVKPIAIKEIAKVLDEVFGK